MGLKDLESKNLNQYHKVHVIIKNTPNETRTAFGQIQSIEYKDGLLEITTSEEFVVFNSSEVIGLEFSKK